MGYPQLSAVMECADAAHGLKGHIISVRPKGRVCQTSGFSAVHGSFDRGGSGLLGSCQLEVGCWDIAERAWEIHAIRQCSLLCRMEAAAVLEMWPRHSVRTLGGQRRRIL